MAAKIGERKHAPKQGGPAANMMPGEKAKDFRASILRLASYLKAYKIRIAISFLAVIFSTVFAIVSPAILGKATDEVVKGVTAGTIDYKALLFLLVVLLAMYLASWAFGAIQGCIMAAVSQKIIYRLRDELSQKLDRLPLKFFDRVSYGEVQSRMVNDIETINQTLSATITQMITAIVTLTGIIAMMLIISPIMTLIALVVIPVSLIVIRAVVSRSQGHFKNQQAFLGKVNSHVEEMYSGQDIIKAFNREKISEETFDEYNDSLCEAAWKSQFLSGLMMPLTQLIGNLAYVVVCLVGGFLALKGKISIGQIQAFIQYVRSFNQPVQQVANIANQLQSTAAAAERVFEMLDEEEIDLDAIPTIRLDPDKVEGRVTFEHVKFQYRENEPVIHDFSFEAKPGQRIAIVGPTGAGKTTIVKLLMRYYELKAGRILVDGYDIKNLSRGNLRELFGMVLQDTWLNSGSIADNIRYGRMDATDEEVREAAKAARAHYFIKTQPDKYKTEINEEASNISAGQKQLLTIARAFLADAPILIFDEATSSVDTRTEKRIQEAMAKLMKDRTSFIIAHRLSTIKDADHILVINEGDIIEQGSHENLLAEGGFYAKLYSSQFAD